MGVAVNSTIHYDPKVTDWLNDYKEQLHKALETAVCKTIVGVAVLTVPYNY